MYMSYIIAIVYEGFDKFRAVVLTPVVEKKMEYLVSIHMDTFVRPPNH